ncbi:hypothetical protein Tco_1160000, partial [Tanacetum coccineum]
PAGYPLLDGYPQHGYPPPGGYPQHGYPFAGYRPAGYPPSGYPGPLALHHSWHGGPGMGTILAGGAATAAAVYGAHHLTYGHDSYGHGDYGHFRGHHDKFKHGKFKHGKFGNRWKHRNEVLTNTKERHEIVRKISRNTEQQAAQICTKCGVKMGEYFCDICKFYEDDVNTLHIHLLHIVSSENYTNFMLCCDSDFKGTVSLQ